MVERSIRPVIVYCIVYVRQNQRANPKFMGFSQDLRYPVLVSASVDGRFILDLQSEVKTLSWDAVLWLLAAVTSRCPIMAGLVRCLPFCYASNVVEFSLGAVRFVSSVFRALAVRGRTRLHPLPDVNTIEWDAVLVYVLNQSRQYGDLDNEWRVWSWKSSVLELLTESRACA